MDRMSLEIWQASTPEERQEWLAALDLPTTLQLMVGLHDNMLPLLEFVILMTDDHDDLIERVNSRASLLEALEALTDHALTLTS